MRAFFLWSLMGLRISPSVPHYGGGLPSGLFFFAHTLVWAFFVIPCGTSYFEAWLAVYFTTMPIPLF